MQEREYEWNDISDDLIPFMAQNQYKELINKYYEEANKDKLSK